VNVSHLKLRGEKFDDDDDDDDDDDNDNDDDDDNNNNARLSAVFRLLLGDLDSQVFQTTPPPI
jgi:TATA-binding protein-associated factor Taf7